MKGVSKINENLNGYVIKFLKNGWSFKAGDLAVCVNGAAAMFLGLSGHNFCLVRIEYIDYELVDQATVEDLLAEVRAQYHSK